MSKKCIFPMDDKFVKQRISDIGASHWRGDLLSFAEDVAQFKALPMSQQLTVIYILAFFGGSELDVIDVLMHKIIGKIKNAEVRAMYQAMMAQEFQHELGYHKALAEYIKSTGIFDRMLAMHTDIYVSQMHDEAWDESEHFIDNVETPEDLIAYLLNVVDAEHEHALTSLKKKREWFMTQINVTDDLEKLLFLMVLYEGIGFISAFSVIYYYKSIGQLNKLGLLNDFVAPEEFGHAEAHIHVLLKYAPPLDHTWAVARVTEFVDIEGEFATQINNEGIGEVTPSAMKAHIIHIAHFWMNACGITVVNHIIQSPFAWWDTIGYMRQVNFFEREGGGTYRRGSAITGATDGFSVMHDF